jgi:tetratricopeptide (TPR) repeat protein
MSSTGEVAGEGSDEDQPGGPVSPRVFISYAHDDAEHEERVRGFWLFLRANAIDAKLDRPGSEERRDWAQWMSQQVRRADRILVIASPQYKLRAEGQGEPDQGRGVQWESWLIRDRFIADQRAGLRLVLPVVLPGCSTDDIPSWLAPAAATYYLVDDYTVDGAETLLRTLTGQPGDVEPPLGTRPDLPPRDTAVPQPRRSGAVATVVRPVRRTQVLIEAERAEDGQVASAVWLGGSLLCQGQAPEPVELRGLWGALRLPPLPAADRMVEAGRRLAGMLMDEAAQRAVAAELDRLAPGDAVEVVLSASGPLLSLPIELIRLVRDGGETVPLGLMPGVSMYRRPAEPDGDRGEDPAALRPALPGSAGPLKILAAVAAPDETKTSNAPLDVEAEMQAVLDAVSKVAGHPKAQVRILEVASPAQIRDALRRDQYHVLHLSAHGSAESVELEDEDGNPVTVTADALKAVLRQAGRPLPLIVLSSCSDGSAAQAMAASLVGRGADRVIAMLAPVTDGYATQLARRFYQELAAGPDLPAGQVLASARCLAEEDRSRAAGDGLPLPEYGVATLLATGGDGPLVDPALPPEPLAAATIPAGGRSVRELPVGALIGRRAQLRTVTGVLRRTPAAEREFGAASGVVLTGIGGIGKTALAGRVISRLRGDGWLIAVHEGKWNPTGLIAATAQTIAEALPGLADNAQAALLRQAKASLTDQASDDGPKLNVVAALLMRFRLLVVFDDFEQNLTPGGQDFLDPAIGEVISALAGNAETGGLLVTCRYPLPGPDRFLAEVPVPGLSVAELQRMFLRLPALADLGLADQVLLIRAIGGHPRLIEFTDALLRSGVSSLRHVRVKLRDLASAEGVDLSQSRPMDQAIDQAIVFGSANILLAGLLTLLTPRQAAILSQVAVCRAPMTVDDLAFALTPDPASDPRPTGTGTPDLAGLRADTERLTNLTLLSPGPDISMHPWTAELATHHLATDPAPLHQRASAMRLRRFEQRRGDYSDLLDIPRHLAALHRYDDIADVAEQATQILPGTLATLAYLAETRPLIPPGERAWTLVADLEVQALLSTGDLSAAARQLRATHQQVQAGAAAYPANAERQRDLAVSHERLGDVAVAAGDLAAAHAAYQAALDITARLAAANPANTARQHDLSVGYDKLGDVAAAAGDLTTARAAYQASLDIRRRLAETDPANTQWQRDLCVSHERLGDIAVAAGDLAAARTHYQADQDIAKRLAATNPANTEWQRDVSISHDKLGNVAMAAGDLAAARISYQASLDIRLGLTVADPDNRQWQRDLSASYNRLGDIATTSGDLEAARAAYQASLDIRMRLATADSADRHRQRDLSISYNKLGDVAATAGDLEAARAAFQASLDIALRLAAADPANIEWQRDVSISHERLASVAVAAGELTAARTAYQAGLDIRVRLAAADPANTGWQRDLAVSQSKLGNLAAEAGDLEAARAAFQASLDITARIAALDAGNTGWQRDLAINHSKLGNVAVAAGDLTAAHAHYQASHGIASRLAAADPSNTQWQRDLAVMQQKIDDLGNGTS